MLLNCYKKTSHLFALNRLVGFRKKSEIYRTAMMSIERVPTKPPNILYYTSGKHEKVVQNVAANLRSCLKADKYVVNELTKSEAIKSPWKMNTALLFIYSDDFSDNINDIFYQYIKRGGKVLLCCSNFHYPELGLICNEVEKNDLCTVDYQTIQEAKILRGNYSFHLDTANIILKGANGEEFIKKSSIFDGLIISELHLAVSASIESPCDSLLLNPVEEEKRQNILRTLLKEEFKLDVESLSDVIPKICYVLAENKELLSEFKTIINFDVISLGPCAFPTEQTSHELKVPLIFGDTTSPAMLFDDKSYYSSLKSEKFGKLVLFFPVVTSTMIPAQRLDDINGAVVVANRQISGRGRSSNVWLSPEGSASFTLHFSLSLSSCLGQRLSIVQHMASLAVVHCLRKQPCYEQLQLRLKWPNDLYYETDTKIGGILVNTTIQGNMAHVYVGIGVNVSNPHPTMSINTAIEFLNTKSKLMLPTVSVEKIIALTLTELESIINVFERSGPDEFLRLYYLYWLHDSQNVTIESLNLAAKIKGLDDYGFLITETTTGQEITLQPDGNRFDIMKNLIVAK